MIIDASAGIVSSGNTLYNCYKKGLFLAHMSNNGERPVKRVVKFVPTGEQRQMKIREWQEVTPELAALLQRLDDRQAANAFVKNMARSYSACRQRVSY
jgi:hypothetical protein